MKYLLTAIMAVVMLSVTACDNKDEDTGSDTAADTAADTAESAE